jgi:FAD/FMN-containing dehydrogenase
MSDTPKLTETFSTFLKPEQILSDPDSLVFYGRDWIKDFEPRPSVIVFPENTVQVAQVVRTCGTLKVAIVPSGGRTGLSGGATACNGEVVVSLERMRRILEVSNIDRTITCQAGVALERVQLEAEKHCLYFPVDFSTRGSSHIGGNIATNAGGIRVIRYGNIRDWVVGLQVVTGTGEILNLNGSLFKNNTGLDLRGLFIGSEGLLGIITECTLRLTTRPGEVVRVMCALTDVNAVLPLLSFCRSRLRDLSAFEFMEGPAAQEVILRRGLRDPFANQYSAYVLVECEQNDPRSKELVESTFGEAYESGLIQDVVISNSVAQAQELMNIRDLIGETLASHYTLHKNDISVPVPAIPAFLADLHTSLAEAYPHYRVLVFGHIGDGNLHINVLKPDTISDASFWESCRESDERVFSVVAKYRGSISAEHGVGILKKGFLHHSRSAEEIGLMRGIKAVFDPLGILNPGKVLPD